MAVTADEVVFGRATDAVTLPTFWRVFEGIEVSEEFLKKIRRDLDTQRRAAAVQSEARRRAAEKAERLGREELDRHREERERRRLEREHVAWEKRLRAYEEEDRREGEAYAAAIPRLRACVERRGIRSLLHFTRVENLARILSEGLRPRAELRDSGAVFNDVARNEGVEGASCLSVGFPNYKLFHSFARAAGQAGWVVLEVKPDALYSHFCLFNATNAANARCRSLATSDRSTPEAFERMFAEEAEGIPAPVRRPDLGIPEDFTTDPQAEVLVVGTVSPTLISRVAFETLPSKAVWLAANPSLAQDWAGSMRVDGALFGPRRDHAAWPGNREPTVWGRM